MTKCFEYLPSLVEEIPRDEILSLNYLSFSLSIFDPLSDRNKPFKIIVYPKTFQQEFGRSKLQMKMYKISND